MACLEMYNSNGGGSPMSPRISFSNDFVEIKPEKNKRSPLSKTEGSTLSSSSSSSDFEFSVTNYSMMTADELFFKGKLLPFKDTTTTTRVQRTLKEELLIEEEEDPDDDDHDFTLRPPPPPSSSSSSSKGRWKGLLGLTRTHIGSKRADKINEGRFVHQDTLFNTNPSHSQEEGSN